MSAVQKRILIVDDEQDIRDYLSCLFEDNGYTVRTAADGSLGLEAMIEEVPDLVTLDVTMPHKTGVTLYREMRLDETLCRVPVIVVSGNAAEFERFIDARREIPPPEGIFHKPIDQQGLLAAVRAILP